MHAAIKALEDTLLIRRLQARELAREQSESWDERIVAINAEIVSLERGLCLLKEAEANVQHPTPNAQCRMENKGAIPGVTS